MYVLWYEPFPTKSAWEPLWLPATLMRSSCTPGTCCMTFHTSRDVGTCCSSAWANVAPVSVLRVSTRGVEAETVTVSCFGESAIFTVKSVFLPRVTTTFCWTTLVNPGSSTVAV